MVGRQHAVSILYAPAALPDYADAAVRTVMQIHTDEDAGDVLVFLTGQEDIEAAAAALAVRAASLPDGAMGLLPRPLYAALPVPLQLKALAPAPAGTRKV